MRYRYSIWRLHPVYDIDGTVRFTTGYRLYYYTKVAAQVNKFIIDAWDSIVHHKSPHRKTYYARLSYIPKYYIDKELNVEWADAGTWRYYQLNTSGDNLAELIKEATISEIDQDGGEINCYGLHDCSSQVFHAAIVIIEETMMTKK